jgi:hypothetical protein
MTYFAWAWDHGVEIATIASPVITICTLAFWSQVPSRREFKAAKAALHARIDAVGKKADGDILALDGRTTRIEGTMAGLATKDDINKVLVALAKQDGQRSALEAKVDGLRALVERIERPVDLIQEHLMRDRGP